MTLSKVELAVLNNIRWYEAMFAAHGLASETNGSVWRSHETPPPFYSNLVVLAPATTVADIRGYAIEIERQPRPDGWSLKDSYACLELAPLGYTALFRADWIWREATQAGAPVINPRLAWVRLVTPSSLAEWERAWWGDAEDTSGAFRARQFPESLLGNPDCAFFAGLLRGQIVAGGIANRSPGVVGLSNVFAPREFLEESWSALTVSISATFAGAPIVGYERGTDLNVAESVGFARIGKLCVWWRPG